MLGFLIRAAIGLAVAGAAAGIISVVIKGVINKQKVQEQMRSSNVSNFLVEAINNEFVIQFLKLFHKVYA